MSRVNARSRFLPMLAAVWSTARAEPPRVVFSAGQVEVQTGGHRLSEVLNGFRHYGIEVRFDPAADAMVSASLPRQPVDDGLRKLLGSVGYVTRWNLVDTPAGREPVLAGIDVFRRGDRGVLLPLEGGASGGFDVFRDPSGREYLRDEVLLGLKENMDAAAFHALVASVNGYVIGSEKRLGVYRIKLPPGSSVEAAVDILRRNPAVALAEPNAVWRLPGGGTAAPTAATTTSSQAPAKGLSNGGSPVAILDSGLLPSLDLGAWVSGRFDATRPGEPLGDDNGHGSQMALIATGAVQPSGVIQPAETGVPVLAIKAFDAAGVTSTFTIIEALRYARDQGARVASLSWGSNEDSDFLRTAVTDAMASGLVVVAAAGNEPTGQPVYPAAYPGVLAIGALQPDGTRWASSNYGEFLTATAPGFAELPVGHDGPPGPYAGTSIATPWVARAFSQYFAQNPQASPAQAIQDFRASLIDAGTPGRDAYYGSGVFNRQAEARFLSGKAVGNP